MEKWTKFNKIMSWCVMLSGVAGSLYLAITLFTAAGSLGSYSSYYSSVASATIATYVWLGIFTLLIGLSVSIGIFAAWNMLIEWYANSRELKRKMCGEAVPAPYSAPVQYVSPVQPVQPVQQAPVYAQQPANWQCSCGAINGASSAFCQNCGRPRQ